MPATVIVGLQWGDEGKGKTTDFLAEQVAMVVRYQGGDNAGHTVVVGDEVFKLQLCPSGVLYPHITSVIGNGVVVNPATLIGELDMLAARGIDVSQGPGQPQRARDHAVPRRPRQGQREPPRGRQGGHDRPRHRADVRRPRLAPGPPDGGPRRRAGPPRADRPGPPGQEPAARGDGRRDLRGRAARRPVPGLGRAPRPAPRRLDLARPGRAPARRPRPPRGRPGHAAGPRPRLLPVRHLLQPGGRRRLHRRRHRPAPGRRGHRRHEGLLDARGLRALPDRAVRRDRPRDRGARPRVRDRDRARPPRRLVRRRARCATPSPSTPTARSCSTSSTSCPASRRSGCAWPTRSTAGASRRGRRPAPRSSRAVPIYEDFEGWEEPIHDVRSLADLPENARRYVSALEEHAGVPIVFVSVGPERTQTIERAWRPMRHRPDDAGLSARSQRDARRARPHPRPRRRRSRARARLEAGRRAGGQRGGRGARERGDRAGAARPLRCPWTRWIPPRSWPLARAEAAELVVVGPGGAAGRRGRRCARGGRDRGLRPAAGRGPDGDVARRSATRSPRRPGVRMARARAFAGGDEDAAAAFVRELAADGALAVLKADGLAAGKGVIVTDSLEQALALVAVVPGRPPGGGAGARGRGAALGSRGQRHRHLRRRPRRRAARRPRPQAPVRRRPGAEHRRHGRLLAAAGPRRRRGGRGAPDGPPADPRRAGPPRHPVPRLPVRRPHAHRRPARRCSSATSGSGIRRPRRSCRASPGSSRPFSPPPPRARCPVDLGSRLPVRDEAAVTIVLAAEGYPGDPRRGDAIEGIDRALDRAPSCSMPGPSPGSDRGAAS